MRYTKLITKYLLIAMTLWVAVPFTVSAQTPPTGNLIVEFQSTPLFQELNFLPGDMVSRWVKVTNNTSGAEDIVVDAINVVDTDDLGSAFELQIKLGATVVYSGTFKDFFNAGEVLLSNLAGNGGQAQYFFTAQFLGPSGDEYQEKSLGFDLLVGFSGGSIDDNNPPVTIVTTSIGGEGGGGGGGNGPISSDGLTIYNEAAVTGNSDETVAAVVSWDTNYPSTSRVIYGTTPGVFDYGSPPNYGYEFSTPEYNTPASPNGVIHHVVALSGLMPNVAYYYRVISTASPPTIGYERSFVTTTGSGGDGYGAGSNPGSVFLSANFGTIPPEAESGSGDDRVPGGATSTDFGFNDISEAGSPAPQGDVSFDGNTVGGGQLALASFGDILDWWWLLLLILIILFVLWIVGRKKIHNASY